MNLSTTCLELKTRDHLEREREREREREVLNRGPKLRRLSELHMCI